MAQIVLIFGWDRHRDFLGEGIVRLVLLLCRSHHFMSIAVSACYRNALDNVGSFEIDAASLQGCVDAVDFLVQVSFHFTSP